jgi:hypothetical protein
MADSPEADVHGRARGGPIDHILLKLIGQLLRRCGGVGRWMGQLTRTRRWEEEHLQTRYRWATPWPRVPPRCGCFVITTGGAMCLSGPPA